MQSFLYFYSMPLIARTIILFVFLAVCAGASGVQVIEGDADGEWDLSAKKLQAMAAVYLAELGHVPSLESKTFAVSFSASGPAKRTIQMKKILPGGGIEEDSVMIAGMDDADDAVKKLLVRNFRKVTRAYKGEKPAEVFFMDPVFVDVDDSTARLAARNTEATLAELGYELAENRRGSKLQMVLVKLKDAYWLGMMRIEGGEVVRGVHKKFMPGDDLEIIAYSLVNKVMDSDTELSVPTNEVVDSRMTHTEACRATEKTDSFSGLFLGFFSDMLCNFSDYVGLEGSAGGRDLYGYWYPDVRFDVIWGFSDNHAWLLGLEGTMGTTQSRWAFESVHRFSQTKGLFVDFVWGWGFDGDYNGWYMGGDVGLNLFALSSKTHWLSLMLRYDWTYGEDWDEGSRVSINLVYNHRTYFSD